MFDVWCCSCSKKTRILEVTADDRPCQLERNEYDEEEENCPQLQVEEARGFKLGDRHGIAEFIAEGPLSIPGDCAECFDLPTVSDPALEKALADPPLEYDRCECNPDLALADVALEEAPLAQNREAQEDTCEAAAKPKKNLRSPDVLSQSRPSWTCCLIVVCIGFIPGALYNHTAVVVLLPALKDLPANVVQGFDEIFKFAYLKRDSLNVKSNAAAALTKCNIDAIDACSIQDLPTTDMTIVNTNEEKEKIAAEFAQSLGIITQVTGDPYFGTAGLASTNKHLSSILDELDKVNTVLPCVVTAEIYCAIYTSAKLISEGIADVEKAIDALKNSELIREYENYADYVMYLHAWPYILAIGASFFGCFWYKGGICCCCHGRSKICCALFPYVFFLILAFLFYGAITAAGVFVKYEVREMKVAELNGKPTIQQVAEHTRNTYPEFWDAVLKNPLSAVEKFWLANVMLLGVALLLGIYSICDCACCPYRKLSYNEAK